MAANPLASLASSEAPGKKKNVIKQLLGRGLTGIHRNRSDTSSYSMNEAFDDEESDQTVLRPVQQQPRKKTDYSDEDLVSPRYSRNRAGGMSVPKNTEVRVEKILEKILMTYQASQAPVAELEAMRLECTQLQIKAENALSILKSSVKQSVLQSKLSEYEYVADELLADPLSSKFKFGLDGVLYLDDRLVVMERRASKSIRSSSLTQLVIYALLALVFGVILARYL